MNSVIDIEPIADWIETATIKNLIEPKQIELIRGYQGDLGVSAISLSEKLYGISYTMFSKAAAEDFILLLHLRLEQKNSSEMFRYGRVLYT